MFHVAIFTGRALYPRRVADVLSDVACPGCGAKLPRPETDPFEGHVSCLICGRQQPWSIVHQPPPPEPVPVPEGFEVHEGLEGRAIRWSLPQPGNALISIAFGAIVAPIGGLSAWTAALERSWHGVIGVAFAVIGCALIYNGLVMALNTDGLVVKSGTIGFTSGPLRVRRLEPVDSAHFVRIECREVTHDDDEGPARYTWDVIAVPKSPMRAERTLASFAHEQHARFVADRLTRTLGLTQPPADA